MRDRRIEELSDENAKLKSQARRDLQDMESQSNRVNSLVYWRCHRKRYFSLGKTKSSRTTSSLFHRDPPSKNMIDLDHIVC